MSQLTLFPIEPRLSKSKFVSGLQCHKRLYLEIHSPELATAPDEQTQAVLDNGTGIGELARRQFPCGVLVAFDHRNVALAVKRTRQLLDDPAVTVIFEGAFQFDHVLIRVDILERIAGTSYWRLIEVKASTRVKAIHLDDLAVQAYVLEGFGIALGGMHLMHLNRQYVYRGGEVDLAQLFLQEDVTNEVRPRLPDIPARLSIMKQMLLEETTPDVEPDSHCHVPFSCPFWEHCTAHKDDRWVFHLPGGKRTFDKLVQQGIELIDHIPDDFKLSGVQQRMKANLEWIGPDLKSALQTIRYPVHHLDFETFMPSVPQYPMTHPYHTLPFQWSNHIEMEDGTVRHDHYLCVEQRDPREELAVTLLASLGHEGSICVYSGYEWRILTDLAEAFPKLRRELSAAASRLWDLLIVVRKHYYHPGFLGSFSIKAVLPALVPSLDYGDLEIQEGGLAPLLYARMIAAETTPREKTRICAALLDYCKRDTLGMLEIRRALLGKTFSEESSPVLR